MSECWPRAAPPCASRHSFARGGTADALDPVDVSDAVEPWWQPKGWSSDSSLTAFSGVELEADAKAQLKAGVKPVPVKPDGPEKPPRGKKKKKKRSAQRRKPK